MTKHTYDDADLERMIRDGLRHHAGDAPSGLGAPLPGSGGSRSSGSATAAAVPPSSPRWRWVLPAAAAVAALAVPGAILVANTLRNNDFGVANPPASASRTAPTGGDSSTSESPTTAAVRTRFTCGSPTQPAGCAGTGTTRPAESSPRPIPGPSSCRPPSPTRPPGPRTTAASRPMSSGVARLWMPLCSNTSGASSAEDAANCLA